MRLAGPGGTSAHPAGAMLRRGVGGLSPAAPQKLNAITDRKTARAKM